MFKIILVAFGLCFFLERMFVGWKLPQVQDWYSRVIMVNVAQLGIVLLAGFSWERWLSSASVFHLSNSLRPGVAGFLAYFLATLVFYGWHRLRHESDFFWKYFHQIHHSPQRLEVITSFYKHPLEMLVNSILGSLIIYTILGLNFEAGAYYTLFTALGEFFYHTNVKTPRWIGYIFQRPEMHRIHHEYGKHKNNYGDFVIWDMIFGTYENPRNWSNRCGFDENLELKFSEMLLFKDVHKSINKNLENLQQVLQEGDLVFTAIKAKPFKMVAATTLSWTSHVGMAFLSEQGEWMVFESKVPRVRVTPLHQFLSASENQRFEVLRPKQSLETSQIEKMKSFAKNKVGQWYNLGFNFDSKRLFCSKFIHQIYSLVGIEVGRIQTFEELLSENPQAPINFWRIWFLGFIPWSHTTLSPASQLRDEKFFSVASSHSKDYFPSHRANILL